MTKIRCSSCGMHLTISESEHHHGWHTTFYIKCHSCHQLFAEFPSSKPMVTDVDKFVNVKLPEKVMNEVTMRSALIVHCSGFSWRDLLKFSPSNSSSDTDDSSGASSEGVCDICYQRQPPSERHRSISKWSKVNWIGCEKCERWFHQCCTELPKTTDVSSIQFVCYNCK